MCRLGRPDSGSPQPLAFRAFEPWPAGRGPDRTAGRPSQRPSQGGCLRGIRLWQPAATLKGGRVLAIVAGVGYGNSSLISEAPVFREASKQREVHARVITAAGCEYCLACSRSRSDQVDYLWDNHHSLD